MKIILVYLILVFASLNSHAGGGATVGDGGHGVRCGGGSYELLDFYEARRLYKFEPEFPGYKYSPTFIGNSMRTARARALEVVPRTKELDELFAAAVHIDQSNTTEWWSTPLRITGDLREMIFPLKSDCQLLQFARREPLGRSYRYAFSIEAWDHMSPEDEAALILHEASHTYFKSNKNTLAIREFVMYVSAPADFRKRNAAIFKKLVETRQAVDPHAFRN